MLWSSPVCSLSETAPTATSVGADAIRPLSAGPPLKNAVDDGVDGLVEERDSPGHGVEPGEGSRIVPRQVRTMAVGAANLDAPVAGKPFVGTHCALLGLLEELDIDVAWFEVVADWQEGLGH